ncbi:hypothetical protein [Amycolatopsis minnesotensis]|uniref:Peptidase inhibitor family I36 n=1 Tax=Amycolatopsis minnesotensis TaxID=337894 RepID=A0ABP5E0R4_9PSEU
MRRYLAFAGTVLAAGALATAPGTASAEPAAPAITCGNHMEPVGGDKYHRKYYWGNCSGAGVRVNVWYTAYSGGPFDRFDHQQCAPANQDALVGETTNYLVSRYYVKDTAGAC